MIQPVIFKNLGKKSFKETWELQEKLFNQIVEIKKSNRKTGENKPTPNYFLVVEHPHVYTLGKTGNLANLLINQQQLMQKNIEFYKINRGGDITYHGPGQLVIYPILDLDHFFTDIHKYLRLLEEVVIKTLTSYGLSGKRSQGETGVWLDIDTHFARKICALGIRVSRWVTMHGLALNVNVDLSYFQHIVPCGIQQKSVTSLHSELKTKIPLQEVLEKLMHHFADIFQVEFEYDMKLTLAQKSQTE